ncbi:MAG: hypothetical protein K8R21_10640 [Leptospira sp.]|nr:hypothetical protein [Leptospira sp.]
MKESKLDSLGLIVALLAAILPVAFLFMNFLCYLLSWNSFLFIPADILSSLSAAAFILFLGLFIILEKFQKKRGLKNFENTKSVSPKEFLPNPSLLVSDPFMIYFIFGLESFIFIITLTMFYSYISNLRFFTGAVNLSGELISKKNIQEKRGSIEAIVEYKYENKKQRKILKCSSDLLSKNRNAIGILFFPKNGSAGCYPDGKKFQSLTDLPVLVPESEKKDYFEASLLILFPWFFSVILGPPVGWILTTGQIQPENAMGLIYYRIIIGAGLPLLFCAGFLVQILIFILMKKPDWKEISIQSTAIIFITLLAVWSVRNSFLDYRLGIQEINSSIVAFRDSDDVKAVWYNRVNSVKGLGSGTWEGKMESGEILSFENPPICFCNKKKYFYESEFGQPMKITYLKNLNKILKYELNDH